MKNIERFWEYFILVMLLLNFIGCKVEIISSPVGCIFFYKDLKKIDERWRKKLLRIEERGRKMVRWYDRVKMMCEMELKKNFSDFTQINGVLDVYETLKVDSLKCFKVQYLTFYPLTVSTYVYSKKVVLESRNEINVYNMSEWMKVIKDIENKYGKESEITKRMKFFLKKEFQIHTNF